MLKSLRAISSIAMLMIVASMLLTGCERSYREPRLNRLAIAARHFGADSSWYLSNIPFFQCADSAMESVYYYRWKLYKAHIRETGPDEFVITEFINHVAWDRAPWCTINAASMHHILEGRWLKDSRYLDGYIRYLWQGGNDRRYSESVADATYHRYLVNADTAFVTAWLDSMVSVYRHWQDHYDSKKGLYYIPAMPDATEYTIASIDQSGGTAGFDGGEAFRPTLNSYQYGNAMAIAALAALHGDRKRSQLFQQEAQELKQRIQDSLWNPALLHFTDRHQTSNAFVHYWNFIRGRELAGFAPWYFNLPDDNTTFGRAWNHALDTTQLMGRFGYRTNEPSYQYYFKQFVWFRGQRGSQWNGPSWPYQSSQVLTAMANLINNYRAHPVTDTDYVSALRKYTRQHFLPDGKLNLVENYDPNAGGPIVHYYWSNHYNHSTYNNLIISGLCGIRPSASDTLTLRPIIDETIPWFRLSGLSYHGHMISVLWDATGQHFKSGKGLSVFVDGESRVVQQQAGRYQVYIGAKAPTKPRNVLSTNLALNIRGAGFPRPAASVNNHPDSLYQAIDGRAWHFAEVTNGWSTIGSSQTKDWYAIAFDTVRYVNTVTIYPFVQAGKYQLPEGLQVEYLDKGLWQTITNANTMIMTGNTTNRIQFGRVAASAIRFTFQHTNTPVFLSEVGCYDDTRF